MRKLFLIIAISVLCINYNGIAKALNNAKFEFLSVGNAGFDKARIGHANNETITYKIIPLSYTGPCPSGGDDCQVVSVYTLRIQKSEELNNAFILTFNVDVLNDLLSDGNLIGPDGQVVPVGGTLKVKTLASNYVLPNSLIHITNCDEFPELVGTKVELTNKRPDENGDVVIKLVLAN